MTRPRKELVCIDNTPYYHITSRCVRRAFLCGFDQVTQTSYEHRRQWIEERIRLLSSIFAIDVCAYAVMSNHYHIVIKLAPDQAKHWTDQEVMKRWLCLFKGTLLVRRYKEGATLSEPERQSVRDTLAIYKERLTDLGWFMKCLNEPIARRANKEDDCKGHFWEARYQSPALTTAAALITCMAYVDLNPIRSGMADRPEQSDHTSIKERLAPQFDLKRAVQDQLRSGDLQSFDLPLKPLLGFSKGHHLLNGSAIPIRYSDYVELVDWTGRVVRSDKVGVIPSHLDHILDRIQLTPQLWQAHATQFEQLQRGRSRIIQSNK